MQCNYCQMSVKSLADTIEHVELYHPQVNLTPIEPKDRKSMVIHFVEQRLAPHILALLLVFIGAHP